MRNVLIFIADFFTGIVTLSVIGYAMNSSSSPEEIEISHYLRPLEIV